ncbi:helix-turn-helix domain-containing protein [Actinoalloteichus fjordicus]|uniref:DNA binding protein with helix-turn-helix domain n=1 Tax=Actinoalloteichus fjordicus TaxID=1612552 RepID=A0AAC9PQZ0_9PSEU|nr:helix-turn-helix transcriptional regulator [Actinoalloteichus fjordicus]APU13553.1 DNA binding protein with helix-turn-helix domain [Actinoalloteichus fjordicus]
MTRTKKAARSPRARALGTAIAEARKAAELSQRAAAQLVGWHHTRLARAETGAQPPDAEDVASLLAVLNVTGARRDKLLTMARDIGRSPWTVVGAAGVPGQLATLVDYEREAVTLMVSTPLIVPGLLQTMGYARAIISAGGASAEIIEARVMYRMGRQEILRSGGLPLHLTAVCTEWALRMPTGSHSIMEEQMSRLLEWGSRDNVDVRVLPASLGSSGAFNGNFSVYEFADSAPVVHLEHLSASTFVDDVRDVEDFVVARDTVLKEAMSSEDSLGLIRDVYLPYHRERQRDDAAS